MGPDVLSLGPGTKCALLSILLSSCSAKLLCTIPMPYNLLTKPQKKIENVFIYAIIV